MSSVPRGRAPVAALLVLTMAAAPAVAWEPETPEAAAGAAPDGRPAPPPRRSAREAARTFVEDGRYLFTFPRRVTRKGAWTTAAVVAGTVILIGRDDEIRREVVEDPDDARDRLAGRIEPLGKHWFAAGGLAAAWMAGRTGRSERLTSASATAFEAFLWTTVITSAAKGVFGRERPADGADHHGFWEGDTIFPSGHTARSFAVAAVFADRYGRPAAWIGYPLAALVGLSTVQEDTHWASDILAGAGLGLAIGKGIAGRHPGPGRTPGPGGAGPRAGPIAWRIEALPGGVGVRAAF